MKARTLFDWNILLMTDSYKVSHKNGYVKGLKKIQSYLESRGGKYGKTVFFGLQYFLKRYLAGKVITKQKIDEAEAFWNAHFGRTDVFPRQAWLDLWAKHNGYLPIRICAVPEGSIIPYQNVLLTIENTDEEFPWLVNYLETLIMKVWYPITIASQSYQIRQDILGALNKSGTPESIDFKCHDFGYRGVSSEETAALGAAAHMISFKGTDTVAGITLLQDYYTIRDSSEDGNIVPMYGFSIPATEHSIMCSFGRDGEVAACENWLDQYPTGLIACVSDTYDIFNACEKIWGGVLKEKVLKREGTLVIRPDSGDFFKVIPQVLEILWKQFGGEVNKKGFKVLDSHVRVIQGDGMNPDTIKQLFAHIVETHGWSADNLVVGSGGGLLQKVDRDIQKFAIKACAALVDDKWIDIWKDPVTDKGKRSKTGRLELVKINGSHSYIYDTVSESEALRLERLAAERRAPYQYVERVLVPVFENGTVLKEYDFSEIRKNAGVS
jgi:nicotinamide phosphoribosyltransferase